MNENIIKKIQNLLKRTVENGASVSEMETALKLAHNLMEKYSLSFEDLKVEDISIKEGDKQDIETKNTHEFLYMAQAIAKLFHCDIVTGKKYWHEGKKLSRGRRYFVVVGETLHIATVEFILAEIFLNVTELFHQYSREQGFTINNVLKEKYSFERGYFIAVQEKARRLKKEQEDERGTGTSLLVIDNALDVYMKDHYRTGSLGSTSRCYSSNAYNHGYEKGKSQSFDTRFSKTQTKQLTCN